MQIRIEDVPIEDRAAISPCGIVCLGCDMQLAESLEASKKLVEIWRGFNMDDVGPLVGLTNPEVRQVYALLDKSIKYREENGRCRGCYHGEGPASTCSIAKCVKSKGYWTCAECDDFDSSTNQICQQHDVEKRNILGKPMEARPQAFELLCERYCNTNIENLKRFQEIGYIAFINEMKEKVNYGWRTWQVISPKKVFLENFMKLYESINKEEKNDSGK